MEHDYSGTPFQFGERATYACNFGFFFEHDKEQADFTVECLDTGEFDYPVEWPNCVSSECRK